MENSSRSSFTPKLSWDVVLTQFDRLIKFASGQQVQKNYLDTMMCSEDLYQEGLIKLYDCWMKWCNNPDTNKDMDEFGAIFKKSLFRAVRKGSGRKKDYTGAPVEFVDLEGSVLENLIMDETTEDAVERMAREKSIENLMEMLGSETSKKILAEIMEPSNNTLYEVWADVARKKMLKSQGKRVNVPKDNTVRMKHIIRSLGLTTKQYDISMSEIKEKAKLTLQYDF